MVTGGSSGIGLEIAKRFKDGKVIISGRREQMLIDSVAELKALGVNADYLQGDVSDPESIKEIFSKIKEMGELRAVVNSAGVSGVGDEVELTLRIDLLGSAIIIEEALAVAGKDTAVVMISSMMGYVVPPNPKLDPILSAPLEKGNLEAIMAACKGQSDTAYNLSKRGFHLLVQGSAVAFGKKGARIVSVSPGIILTPMAQAAAAAHPEQMAFTGQMTPCGRNGEPEDIANAVEFLVSSKASFVTGTDLRVDGGLILNLPKIAAMMRKK